MSLVHYCLVPVYTATLWLGCGGCIQIGLEYFNFVHIPYICTTNDTLTWAILWPWQIGAIVESFSRNAVQRRIQGRVVPCVVIPSTKAEMMAQRKEAVRLLRRDMAWIRRAVAKWTIFVLSPIFALLAALLALPLVLSIFIHTCYIDSVVRQAPTSPDPAPVMCNACEEMFLESDLPALEDCEHPARTCAECYAGWIEAELTSGGWNIVRCPDMCAHELSYGQISRYAEPAVFQRYDEYLARRLLEADPNYRTCTQCNAGQLHDNPFNGRLFTCGACGHKTCIHHNTDWHEGRTCEEYDRYVEEQEELRERRRAREQEEEASRAVVGRRRCPRCELPWERIAGCNHIHCPGCDADFCYSCGVLERTIFLARQQASNLQSREERIRAENAAHHPHCEIYYGTLSRYPW